MERAKALVCGGIGSNTSNCCCLDNSHQLYCPSGNTNDLFSSSLFGCYHVGDCCLSASVLGEKGSSIIKKQANVGPNRLKMFSHVDYLTKSMWFPGRKFNVASLASS